MIVEAIRTPEVNGAISADCSALLFWVVCTVGAEDAAVMVTREIRLIKVRMMVRITFLVDI